MKHARPDYNRFQDPAGKIPDDEPVFLLRGQDRCAPYALRAYAAFVEMSAGPADVVEATRAWAEEMEKWQRDRGGKLPDLAAAT